MNVLWLGVPFGIAAAYWKLGRKAYKIDEDGRYVILDFDHPRLPLFNIAFNVFARLFPAKRFEIEDVIQQAQKRTGLKDLGDEKRFPFRDGLEVLLRDANEGGTLTPLGRLALQERVVRALVDRLQMQDLVKQHPEILDEEISAPVFVIGLARSGTTHMQRCLAEMEELRPLRMYEILQPIVTEKVREGLERGVDPRIEEAKGDLKFMLKGRPLFPLFHGVQVDNVEEHYQLCDGVFRSPSPYLIFPCHKYLDWFAETDPTIHIDYLRRCLQIIQWQDAQLGRPRRPFVLKNANDIFHVPYLKKAFPDCKIVHIHRDVVSAAVSGMHLIPYAQSLTAKIDSKEVAENFVRYIEKLLKRVDWSSCGDDVCHVHFKDFVKDNVKTLEEVATALNLDVSDKSWDRVAEYVKENTQHKNGQISYDPRTFGMTEEELKERFKFYGIDGPTLATEE